MHDIHHWGPNAITFFLMEFDAPIVHNSFHFYFMGDPT